jgi:hypothetical protein
MMASIARHIILGETLIVSMPGRGHEHHFCGTPAEAEAFAAALIAGAWEARRPGLPPAPAITTTGIEIHHPGIESAC